MGFFQGPYPLFDAGCGFNAEQLFFHPLRRHGGGAQGDKRPFGSGGKGMEHTRGELLAGSHVSADQHAAVCRGNLLEELAQLAQRSMQLQATIQEGAITISSTQGSVHVEPVRWK